MELVTPEWGLIFWTTLSFLVLLIILRKFAWKPILNAVSDRESSIQQALAEAEAARKEMQNLQADNERILQEARTEREAMLKEAREIKEKIVADARQLAQAEGEKLLQQAKATIESEKKAAIADIKNQVAELSVSIAEKVIRENFSDKDKQLKLVDGLLGDLKLN